jgi:hypothetical protein
MESNITNPLREPIASASATATVDVLTDRPVTPGNNIGAGGVIAFASRTSALLIATTIKTASFRPQKDMANIESTAIAQ